MRIGTVKQIWRYAVKSMSGEQLEDCTVGNQGIPGDRGWALRDETRRDHKRKEISCSHAVLAKYLEHRRANSFPMSKSDFRMEL
jgi:uncharacterized protein YcbX